MTEYLDGVVQGDVTAILTTRGDILYRDATVPARLAKGAENTLLVMGANDPAWSATLAGLTLTSPTINGTIATTGLTMPAFTLGGNITGNSKDITGLRYIYLSSLISVNTPYTSLNFVSNDLNLKTKKAGNVSVDRVRIPGGTDTVAIGFLPNGTNARFTIEDTAITFSATAPVTGLKLGGALDANRQTLSKVVNITYDINELGYFKGKCEINDATLRFYTPGVAPGFAEMERLRMKGRADETEMAWIACRHTGLKLGGALNADSNLINNVTDPSDPQDAATKQYVDDNAGATVATGTYTGNSSDDRQITVGFKCSRVVVVYNNQEWELIPGNTILHWPGSPYHTVYTPDVLLHGTNGFIVGDSADYSKTANQSGITYYWWAISE